mmetsp:Transcript_11503/g.15145  ORF Transcript_11503/g.15145 Transcript_11503/m.15145 type:complete len:85 (+) Transcript_11503:326-580(+)
MSADDSDKDDGTMSMSMVSDDRDDMIIRIIECWCTVPAFGVSRSVSVCAAWLMSRKIMSLDLAMQTIRAARNEAMPNMGFIANL